MSTQFTNGANPVPGWTPSRVDMGVDGTLSDQSARAAFQMEILVAEASAPGWDGGGYLAGKITTPHGRLTGQVIYVAEGCVPVVSVGQTVGKGTKIVRRKINPYNGDYGNIEIGFADPNEPLQPLAVVMPGWDGDTQGQTAITAGSAFNLLIEDLGGVGGINHTSHQPDWTLLPTQIQKALGV